MSALGTPRAPDLNPRSTARPSLLDPSMHPPDTLMSDPTQTLTPTPFAAREHYSIVDLGGYS